jgi:hypothetical protein
MGLRKEIFTIFVSLKERWSRCIGINSVMNAAKCIGEMAEWSNAAVSKTVVRLTADRGFESPSLRKAKANHPDPVGMVFCFQPIRSELVLIRRG